MSSSMTPATLRRLTIGLLPISTEPFKRQIRSDSFDNSLIDVSEF
jgi:hypothetical protein